MNYDLTDKAMARIDNLIENFREENQKLKAENSSLREENEKLKEENRLIKILTINNGSPVDTAQSKHCSGCNGTWIPMSGGQSIFAHGCDCPEFDKPTPEVKLNVKFEYKREDEVGL
jgi:hypothetical protein